MIKIFFVSLLLMTEVYGQGLVVRSEKQPDVDFTKYKTYYWSEQVDSELDENSYFLNDLVLKSDLRDAVQSELNDRGYVSESIGPDLIINFRVFARPATLRGSEGYGRKYWSENEYAPAANRSIPVKAGTIIFSIVDRREANLVWQGYVSGLIGESGFTKDENKIRSAVNLVFQDYGLRASEYSKR
jgi:hypothetical protein